MSFFKRMLGNSNQDLSKSSTPQGMQAMGVQLQRKFAKGIQYNMKIVIRGERNTGKTCLFHRLQGQTFKEEYLPTDEIQVASIHWNYRATDDVVKVEVWDVVDKGKKKKKTEGLKLDNSGDNIPEEPCLDAEFLDVYKGTHGVIFVYDITKTWTFSYIEREIEKIPTHIPIIVMGNHRDMGHHRTVSEEKARIFVDTVQKDRTEESAQVRYAECSMRNGFGLKYLHMFFNLPFLQLQRETLLKQLETNRQDMKSTVEELEIHEESEEQNYDIFTENLTNKRRKQQEQLASKALSESKLKQDETGAIKSVDDQDIPNPSKPSATVPRSVSQPTMPRVPSSHKIPEVTSTPPAPAVSTPPKPVTPTPPPQPPEQKEQKSGFMSRLFKRKSADVTKKTENSADLSKAPEEMVKSVEDFVPDGEGLDSAFLDDAKDSGHGGKTRADGESDSDEADGNPMVAGFQDDLDSEDEMPVNTSMTNSNTNDIELSSEEEEVKVKGDEDDLSDSGPVISKDVDISSDEETAKPIQIVSKTESVSSEPESVSKPEQISKPDPVSQTEPVLSKVRANSPAVKAHDVTLSESESEAEADKTKSDGEKGESSEGEGTPPRVTATPADVSDHGDGEDEDTNTGIDVPQEDLSNWLDELEKSNPKPATNKVSKGRPKKQSVEDSDDEATVRVKAVSSDVEEAVSSTTKTKKKKKKKSEDKEEEKSQKKTKKKKDKDSDADKKSTLKKDKKKKKKKKEESNGANEPNEDELNDQQEKDEFEAFLGDVDAGTGGGGDYESL